MISMAALQALELGVIFQLESFIAKNFDIWKHMESYSIDFQILPCCLEVWVLGHFNTFSFPYRDSALYWKAE